VTLDKLPRDVLRNIGQCLPARDLLCLGSTCLELRDVVAAIDDIGDVHGITAHTLPAFVSWLKGPGRHCKFRGLAIDGIKAVDKDNPDNVGALLCQSVCDQFPRCLKFIDLQNMTMTSTTVFATSIFSPFKDLDVLRLHFASGQLSIVQLDDSLACRSEFTLVNVWYLLVLDNVVAPHITIMCGVLKCTHMFAGVVCNSLSMVVVHTTTPELANFLSFTTTCLCDLAITLPDSVPSLPLLRHMTSLRTLHMVCKSFMADAQELPASLRQTMVLVEEVFGYAGPVDELPGAIRVVHFPSKTVLFSNT
jgi:hypothetical protein